MKDIYNINGEIWTIEERECDNKEYDGVIIGYDYCYVVLDENGEINDNLCGGGIYQAHSHACQDIMLNYLESSS
jgi:DNA-binding XRE family transcriptional regulator